MQWVWILYKRDLFYRILSPTSALVIGAFSLIQGYFFCALVYYLQSVVALDFWFGNLMMLVLMFTPFLTMRSMNREGGGMDRLMRSIGVPFLAIILAQFLSILTLYVGMIGVSIPAALMLVHWGKSDVGVVWSGIIMIVGLGMALLSIGVMASVWVRRVIGVASLSVGVGLLFWLFEGISTALPIPLSEWVKFLSFQVHAQALMRGILDWKDGAFFIVSTLIFLSLGWWIGESRFSRKWGANGLKVLGLVGVLGLVLWGGDFLGWRWIVSSRYQTVVSPYTHSILAKLKRPVEMEMVGMLGTAEFQQVRQLLNAYHQVNGLIHIKVTPQDRGEAVIRIRANGFFREVPLQELNMILENPTRQFFVGERVLTGVLYRLVYPRIPSVGWVTGHGEVDLMDSTPAGGHLVAAALFHEPYHVYCVTLDRTVSADILVISGAKNALSEPEKQTLIWARSRGMHVIVLGDLLSDGAQSVLLTWGVRIEPVTVLEDLQSSFLLQDRIIPLGAGPFQSEDGDQPVMASASPVVIHDSARLIPLMMSSPTAWAQGNGKMLSGPFWLGVMFKGYKGQGDLVVIGNREWITNMWWYTQGNENRFLNVLAQVMNREPTIRPRVEGLEKLNLSGAQFSLLTMWVLIGVPGFFGSWGLWLWWRRRKL